MRKEVKQRFIRALVMVLFVSGLYYPCDLARGDDFHEGFLKLSSADNEYIDSVAGRIDENGNIFLSVSKEDFLDAGFAPDDLVEVWFEGRDKGYLMPVLKSSSGLIWGKNYLHIEDNEISINRKDRSFAKREYLEDCVGKNVVIKLKEKGGFSYDGISKDIDDYPSLKAYANFRNVKGASLGENALYRSFHPGLAASKYGTRNKVADKLAKKNKIKCVLTLSNSRKVLKTKVSKKDTPYYYSLMKKGKVCATKLNGSYISSKAYRKGMRKQMKYMASHKGPYLIHCVIGRDRTGFAVCLLEALMGVGYDEMADDYAQSYRNYNHIKKGSLLDEYMKSSIDDNIEEMLLYGDGGYIDPESADLKKAAECYLKNALLLSDSQIKAIKKNLSRDY